MARRLARRVHVPLSRAILPPRRSHSASSDGTRDDARFEMTSVLITSPSGSVSRTRHPSPSSLASTRASPSPQSHRVSSPPASSMRYAAASPAGCSARTSRISPGTPQPNSSRSSRGRRRRACEARASRAPAEPPREVPRAKRRRARRQTRVDGEVPSPRRRRPRAPSRPTGSGMASTSASHSRIFLGLATRPFPSPTRDVAAIPNPYHPFSPPFQYTWLCAHLPPGLA